MSLTVSLVSPEKHLLSAQAKMVIARTTEGDIAFEPGHIPFVGVLLPGQVKIVGAQNVDGPGSTASPGGSASPGGTSGTDQLVAVHSGFVEVSGDQVSILSDVAELAAEIDTERARQAQARAQEALAADSNDTQAQQALARAQVRLAVAGESPS